MTAHPESLGGRAGTGGAADWLDELTRQIDRMVEVSADEARSLADGLRRAFPGERLDQALSVIRARWRREGKIDPAELHRLRIADRDLGLEGTIEHWARYTVSPPSIEL